MTEGQLEQEALCWLADVGCAVINGPLDIVQKLLDEGLLIPLADQQKQRINQLAKLNQLG